MSTTAKRKQTAKTDLHCEHCGAEAQIILSTPDELNNEIVDQIEEWNEQHYQCGRPTGEVAIENLAKRIRDASPKYADMEAWLQNHPRRPSWGSPHIDADDDGALRQADVSWWSESVDVPLLRYDGRLMNDNEFYPTKFRAWLIQGPYNYEPFIASRKVWWTGEKWDKNPCLSMSLTEAEQLIATLQGLVDIARAEKPSTWSESDARRALEL
ncbi:UNVERIFIED_ORG: hypothetical protein L601_002000000550 [Gordonia westfalica J30]